MSRVPVSHEAIAPMPENGAVIPSPETTNGDVFSISASELVDIITSNAQAGLTVSVYSHINESVRVGRCVPFSRRANGPAVELDTKGTEVLILGGNIVDLRPRAHRHPHSDKLVNVPLPIFDEHVHQMSVIPFVEEHYEFTILPDDEISVEDIERLRKIIAQKRLEKEQEYKKPLS